MKALSDPGAHVLWSKAVGQPCVEVLRRGHVRALEAWQVRPRDFAVIAQ